MPVPNFDQAARYSSVEIRLLIADRVRLERCRLKFSQAIFAERCGVPLRTYKRFELGECDSLLVMISVVKEFDRVVALDLLFPPKDFQLQSRSPVAVLDRLVRKLR